MGPPVHPSQAPSFSPPSQGRVSIPLLCPLAECSGRQPSGVSWEPNCPQDRGGGPARQVAVPVKDRVPWLGSVARFHVACWSKAHPHSLPKNPLQTHTQQGGAMLDQLPATSRPTSPGLSSVLQLREGPGVHVSVFQDGGRTRDPCRGWGQLGPGI